MIVSKDRLALTAERLGVPTNHEERRAAPTGGIGLPSRCYRPLAVDGGAPGSKIGGRIRNSWVPGGGLDPLTPNSMRRGDTSCGTVLAGGGGWASSPTEGGGYWSAPSSSADRASTLTSTAKASAAADK